MLSRKMETKMKKSTERIKDKLQGVKSFLGKLSFDSVLFLNFVKIFLIYTLLMSIISVFVIIMNTSNINNDIRQEMEKEGGKIADTLLNQYNNVKSITGSLAIDRDVRNFINESSTAEDYIGVLNNKILMYKNVSKCIDSVAVYSNKNKYVLYYDKKIPAENFVDYDCIERYLQNRNDTLQVVVRKSTIENKNFITLISGLNSSGIDGAVFVNIDIAKLRNSLGDFINADTDFFLISDSMIVFCKEPDLLFTEYDSGTIRESIDKRTTLRGEGVYASYVNADFGNEWECVYTVSTGVFNSLLWNNNRGMILLLIASFLMGLIFSFVLSINISKPITNLIEIINKYSRNGKIEEEIINAKQIGTKIISIMESNEGLKREIDNRLSEYRKLQMVALQTQINPHFIYNTLNIISLSAIVQTDNGELVSKLLNDVTKLIRYTYNSEKTVTIGQEVDFLYRYIDLMKICYPNIAFEMDIDEEILECKVVRICVQPLIENAIYHGMAGEKRGRICLTMKGSGDKLIIRVEDDGVGIDEERRLKIEESINDGHEMDKNIGIANIYIRLKLFFGDDVDFIIKPAKDKGTVVEITIPQI